MDVFHVVIDTSMMRSVPFQHADFVRLLRQSQLGKVKIYIPHIAFEEERTAQLQKHADAVASIARILGQLQRGTLGMLVQGLPEPRVDLWSLKDVERNSAAVFKDFAALHKIEVIEISLEHAARAWTRYFNVDLPFDRTAAREERRKDIPDSWILEGGREVKVRKGKHCALVGDKKLCAAFESEGFVVYRGIPALLDDIEAATAVGPLKRPVVEAPPVPLDQLRGADFRDMDVLVLGLIEALNTPRKSDLLAAIVRAGFRADVAEHEARTLVLAGRLTDTATHFIPTNRALAKRAAESEVVINALLRIA